MRPVPHGAGLREAADTRTCPNAEEIVAEQDDKDNQVTLAGAGFLTRMAPLVLR